MRRRCYPLIIKMHYIIYHVKPTPELIDKADIGGAYVGCWIEASSFKSACVAAEREIQLANWQIIEQDEAYEVTEKDYLPGSPELEFYEQALIDKEVLVFHTYSKK